jgi:uroporphyrinogen decarboxylase
MNKRERVLAALDGRRVDRVPFAMWRHYYYQDRDSERLAQATLSFYRRYDPDVIVLTPGPFYMAEGWKVSVRSFGSDDIPHYTVEPVIRRATDWRWLPELDVKSSPLRREVEAVRLTKAQLNEEDAPLIFPLFSPLITADMLCGQRVIENIRSFSNDLRSGLGVIAMVTLDLAMACLEAGADGFFFISRLNDWEAMRAREYRDYGQRFDLQVLEPLADRATIRILGLKGGRLFFDMANSYPVQAVCWETWRSDPSMESAHRQVRCGLMGGLNPVTFVEGSVRDIQGQIAEAVAQTGGWRILIAPSGPLPPRSRDGLLSAVRRVVQEP